MTKFKKLNVILDKAHDRLDQLEAQGVDIQAMRNTPQAKERQAAMARKIAASEKRAAAKHEANRSAVIANAAANWNVGDAIITRRGDRGVVTAIEGMNLVCDFDGTSRKFAASMVKAA